MVRTGKIGSIMDVEIRQVPSSWLPSVSGEKAGLIYFKEWAIGFAYRAAQFGGLVRRAEVEAHTAKEISGVAICKSAALAATAGIICKSGSAS
jgi:hypothetical protein